LILDYRFDFFRDFSLALLAGLFVDFLVAFLAFVFEVVARFTARPLAFFFALVFAISPPS
jgi:hypothetical protein